MTDSGSMAESEAASPLPKPPTSKKGDAYADQQHQAANAQHNVHFGPGDPAAF